MFSTQWGGSHSASSLEKTFLCSWYSFGRFLSFSLVLLAIAAHFWAKVVFWIWKVLPALQSFQQCSQICFGVTFTCFALWSSPLSQSIWGLKVYRKGYPSMTLSCSKLVIKNSCSLVCPLTWMLRVHFWVMLPAEFVVPSMLWMVQSLLSFLVGSFIQETVLGSTKFLVAPLLIKAFSVSRVVDKRKFIIKALCLLINTCCALSAYAATTSTGEFKNLDHQGVPGIGLPCLFHQGEPPVSPASWYQFHQQLLF